MPRKASWIFRCGSQLGLYTACIAARCRHYLQPGARWRCRRALVCESNAATHTSELLSVCYCTISECVKCCS